MVEDLIEEITKPEASASAASKSAARERLLAAAATEERPARQRRFRVGGRGLAVIAALIVIPAGVAVATEIAGDDDDFKSVAECPDLAAAIDAQGINAEGLVLVHCPTPGAEVDNTISVLVKMQERRAQLEVGAEEERVTVIEPSVYYRAYGLDGVAGATAGEPTPDPRAKP